MNAAILLDLLVAGLLGATIWYCWQLNRRLAGLRGGQDELRALIETLNDATRRAQAAIAELKMSSEAVGARLQGQVGSARALADELTMMIETGNNLADRLAGAASRATPAAEHGTTAARPPAAPPRPGAPLTAGPQVTRATETPPSDILRALREVR